MSLEKTKEIQEYVAQSIEQSKKILQEVAKSKEYPVMAQLEEELSQSFGVTLDFVVTQSGEVKFLEAGPRYGQGAHPCCFYDDKKRIVNAVEGVALGIGKYYSIEQFFNLEKKNKMI